MKFTAVLLASALMVTETNAAQTIDWEQHQHDTEQMFIDIPDLIDIKETRFGFRMTNWFLTGVERGLYNDNSLVINSDCFGDQFVTKINEFKYITDTKPFGDHEEASQILPLISIIYQTYYMITTKCGIAEAFNDYMLFCWYKGCLLSSLLNHLEKEYLYILRDINDAAIVWYEGVPEEYNSEKDIEQWITISETSGRSAAKIFKDLTGFEPVPRSLIEEVEQKKREHQDQIEKEQQEKEFQEREGYE